MFVDENNNSNYSILNTKTVIFNLLSITKLLHQDNIMMHTSMTCRAGKGIAQPITDSIVDTFVSFQMAPNW